MDEKMAKPPPPCIALHHLLFYYYDSYLFIKKMMSMGKNTRCSSFRGREQTSMNAACLLPGADRPVFFFMLHNARTSMTGAIW